MKDAVWALSAAAKKDVSMSDLKGKTVLVTGGSRGIGEAIVRCVAAARANVLLHYVRSRQAAESIQAAIGPKFCQLLQADLTDPDAPSELWRAATARVPRVDVLVNNAAIADAAPIDMPSDAWRR